MTRELNTGNYRMAYVESVVDSLVLWESHCHACFEFIGVLEGDITIALEGKQYRLKKEQAMVIPPLCYHTITANRQGDYHRITALFDADAIPASLQNNFADVTVFYASGLEELKKACRMQDKAFYAPLAEALMMKSFYEYVESKQNPATFETDVFLQKTISYVEEHLCEKISLDVLAELTARSKSSFCHLFEEKMKISPKQYILQKRLAYADKLIREGTPPTVAAFRIGYENYSNFYRMYVKRYGVRPGKR